jgi:tetratricopeptide (TPR) repeat protein
MSDDKRAPAFALRKMGEAYLRVGDASYAKRTLEDALKFIQRTDGLDEEARILNSLGLVCLDLGYASKAIGYLEQAVQLARRLEDQQAEQRYLCLLAIAQSVMGKFESARQTFTKHQAILLSQETPGLVGQAQVNIALTYFFQENLPNYLAHLRRSLDFTRANPPAHKRVQQILDQFALGVNEESTAYERVWEASTPLYDALRSKDGA